MNELGEQDSGSAAVYGVGILEQSQANDLENQFAQERGDFQDSDAGRHLIGEVGSDVHRSQPGLADGFEVVRYTRWHPEASKRRDDPLIGTGLDGHDAAGGVDELGPLVIVCVELMAWRKSQGQGADDGALGSLAGSRHSLTLYRKSASRDGQYRSRHERNDPPEHL